MNVITYDLTIKRAELDVIYRCHGYSEKDFLRFIRIYFFLYTKHKNLLLNVIKHVKSNV